MLATDRNGFELLLAADPTDVHTRRVYADWLAEHDPEKEADIRLLARAAELRNRLIAAGWPPSRVFTMETARATKGYDARKAESMLSADTPVVVFDSRAITKTGLRISGDGPILCYRKATSGRWSRGVQIYRVTI